ncbi:helicase-associated domain-containing protein [Paenibacillus glycinis]|uniref:Helicase XPB/Ssl2 N-terminal domain-containing protein n=1 Tax=Paenibacillus glycinis TaxID=2697035 RepID=A0ABW9XVC1_9BACL|nr:helicase-associated domain-containing protein [Paenibacillus glycinis]NBD26418.1 hypothetical protein [Paenibacillus glycinis]
MNVNDIASKLSDEQRRRFREQPIWQAGQPVYWPDTLRNPSCLEVAWPCLSKEAANALALIVCGFGPLPFKEEQLLQAARPGIAGAELRLGLLRLTEAGIVFAVRRGWGEKLHILPQDSFFPWHGTVMNGRGYGQMGVEGRLIEEVDPYAVEAVDEVGYIPPFSMQIVHAMARMADAGLKLTVKRSLTKRTVGKGAEQLFVRDESLRALGVPSEGLGDSEYPLSLRLMLDIALRHGWLVERNGAYRLDAEAWHAWLTQEAAARESELLGHVLGTIGAGSAAAAQGAAVLTRFEAGKWYRMPDAEASFIQSQEPLGNPLPSTLEAWCRLLRQFGWMEEARDGSGNKTFKWRIEARRFMSRYQGHNKSDGIPLSSSPEATAQITPDGDLYVRENCPYDVRWQLEHIAERRRTDHMTVYRMEAKSFKRAALSGYTADGLANEIERFTQEPLPATVRSMILLGMEAHGGDAGNSEHRDDIGQPAEAVRLIARSEAGDRLDSHALQSDDGAYELLHDRISVKHLFAGIDDVPSMWLKQFRAYHHSTRRELMEQALTWRTTVKLNCDGVVSVFVPERIVEEAGKWAVAGYRQAEVEPESAPLKLYPEMWDEMMLVLPGPLGGSQP